MVYRFLVGGSDGLLMAWFSAGVLTNPILDTIMADTVGVNGSGSLRVILGGSVPVIATIEQRNAANTANINSQVIAVAANEVLSLDLPGIPFATSERLRVRLNVGITGSCQASILTL
jgi:hypothetical protein